MLKNWLSKDNLAIQNVSNGQDNKATATVGIASSAKKNEPIPIKQLLVPRVLVAALNYACLALVDISARAIQPVFYSTPIELGGLGLPPHHIGKIFAVYGILNGFVQIFYFAKTHARFGTKNVYIAGIASSLLVFITFPVINYLARIAGDKDIFVWLAVGFQVIVLIFINFSYGGSCTKSRLSLPEADCRFPLQDASSSISPPHHPIAHPLEPSTAWHSSAYPSFVPLVPPRPIRSFPYRLTRIVTI